MTKLRLLKVLISVGILSAIPAVAQSEKRIQFPKGKNSAIVRGVTGLHGVTYVVRARAGQKIVIDLSPEAGIGVKVETNGRYGHMVLLREDQGGHHEVGLEETGDYTIFIGSARNKSIPYVLRIGIVRLADV